MTEKVIQMSSCRSVLVQKCFFPGEVCQLSGSTRRAPPYSTIGLAHQNRTIAIASGFRVDGVKSPEILEKERVSGTEIAARNRKSLATVHRTHKLQCSIALSSVRNRWRFLGSAMGIAIANRKNRCDFGALRP